MGFTSTMWGGFGNTPQEAATKQVKAAQPGVFGQNYTGAYGGYGQALTGLANAGASAYGAQAGAMGNIANAQAQERGARNSATGMAEAARQGAIGNMGSAALGAYGSAAGSALGAWASNQTAYNKALADMMAANQAAVSQFGQSRNQALAGVGDSYSKAGTGLGASSVAGNLNFNMSGGGSSYAPDYSAYGLDGLLAQGGYGGQMNMDPMSISATRTTTPGQLDQIVNPTFGGLNATLASLNSDAIPQQLAYGNADAMGRLDAQHSTSRGQPSQMLGQALSGLLTLGSQNLGESGRGMSQFYASDSPSDYSGYAQSVNGGYQDFMRGNLGMQQGLDQGYANVGNQLGQLWKNSLGNKNWLGDMPWMANVTDFMGGRGSSYRYL
jgi:hypothetical protein